MKTIFLMFLMVCAATAGTLHKLHFTKTNFGIYEDLTTVPSCEHSAYLGSTNVLQTNSQTHYNGHFWWIAKDAETHEWTLYYDDVCCSPVAPLFTYLGGLQHFEIPSDGYFGFCIDNAGQGWLLTAWRDGDPYSYLWKLNINTAECTYLDVVDFGDPNLVTGMYMIEGPLR